MERTIEAMIGMRMVHVAELLVTSVNMATRKQTIATISQPGKSPNTASCSPIHSDRPDTSHASARAKPPPIRKMMLHGYFLCTMGQSRSASAVSVWPVFLLRGNAFGMQKRMQAMRMAGTASPMYLKHAV